MRSSLPSGTTVAIALPGDGRPPARGMVMLPDASGLGPRFDELAQHLADAHGWAVAVVELWPGREHLTTNDRVSLMGTIEEAAVLRDAAAAADVLGVTPVSVLGFCVGGMFAMRAAGTGRFERAVAFYGMFRVPSHWRAQARRAGLRPDGWRGRLARWRGYGPEPFETATAAGACPTLAIVGALDKWTPAPDVQAARAAGITVVAYEQADHGFAHDPQRPSHRPDDAADAWARAVAFLDD